MEKGTLYWLTGLSGAGKTTVGMEVYKLLAEKSGNREKNSSGIVFAGHEESPPSKADFHERASSYLI